MKKLVRLADTLEKSNQNTPFFIADGGEFTKENWKNNNKKETELLHTKKKQQEEKKISDKVKRCPFDSRCKIMLMTFETK